MPPRSVEVFFQHEFIRIGPVLYFARDDVGDEFSISDKQLHHLERIAARRLEEFTREYKARDTAMMAMWDELSDDHRQQAELLFGLSSKSIYGSLNEIHSSRNDIVLVGPAADDRNYEGHLRSYSEFANGLLFGIFIDDLRKPFPEPLINTIDADWSKEIGFVPIEKDRTDRYITDLKAHGSFGLDALDNLRDILNESQYSLTPVQKRLFGALANELNPAQTGEMITTMQSNRYYYSARQLRQKGEPFADSLTPEQKRIAREVMILQIGANRLLLNEPMVSRLEITREQRKAMLENSRTAWLAFLEWQREYKMDVYREMMDVLSMQQQQQFEELVGDPIEKVVYRLRNTIHRAFLLDLDKEIRAKVKK